MASIKSNLMTNVTATPPVHNDVGKDGGRIRIVCDSFECDVSEITAADDYILLCRLPTLARIVSAVFWNDALDSGSGLTMDLGLYTPAGAVVDIDCYTTTPSAVFQAAVVGAGTELIAVHASDLDNMGKRLWDAAGVSTDPGGYYDLALTVAVHAGGDQDGTLSFRIMYVVD